ncbi:MAG TPA: DUF6491 family protein [Vitreimonas sp.]|uniref:DUF6491 family protein n=1 Tax=Vitreimonas sp. TaxID=3069702 RepID=UPI002D3C08FB|nr:DUF6491 family protein [Vitreimonas sp.]HYD89070.1 DUF6491 family protein [Vitreimonas sp.]
MRLLFVAATVAALGACAASSGGARSAYMMGEENVTIESREAVRSSSVLDDETLLVELVSGQRYRIALNGPCAAVTDALTPIFVEGPGDGIDLETRFRSGGHTCEIRSIARMERSAAS